MSLRTIIAIIFLISSPLVGAFIANARERESDDTPRVIRLSAEQITSITSGYTWTIVDVRTNRVSKTFYRDDGVRFTRSDGIINKLKWSVRKEGLRCVHINNNTRCGIIANIDGIITICMQIDPMGDCSYQIRTREEGDLYRLASLYEAQQ